MLASNANNFMLPIDAFIRSVSVNKNTPHAVFLGAGASTTSQIPSAVDCLWEWKRRIVVSRNPSLDRELYDLSIVSIREKIQRLLDSEGRYPQSGSQEEYGVFVEECFPISQDRQKYFQGLSEQANPSNGYRNLCLLALANIVKSAWTTNFDGLVSRVANAAQGLTVVEVGLDTTERVMRAINHKELLIVQLHGDYRYDALKNTSAELKSQDEILRNELIRYLRDVNLIVVGYSGRDKSIMSALEEAYSQPGQGRLYWCGYDDEEPNDNVKSLLSKAKESNRSAFYIRTSGFDDLMARLSIECLEGDLFKRAMGIRNRITSKADIKPLPFSVETTGRTVSFLKSNALEIEYPNQLYQFDVPSLARSGAWKALKDIIREHSVSAGLLKGKVLAIGSAEDIKKAFDDKLQSPLILSPVDDRELAIPEGVVTSIFLNALSQAIAKLRNLHMAHRGSDIYLWKSEKPEKFSYSSIDYLVFDAVHLYLRRYSRKNQLILKPTIRITTTDGQLLLLDSDKLVRNAVLAKRYNGRVDADFEKWRKVICPDGKTEFGYPDDNSIFRFKILGYPHYARVSGQRHVYSSNFSSSIQNGSERSAYEYPEPPLVFSNRQGDGQTKDFHPLRGISVNRPYDFRMTEDVLGRDISVGVLCPKSDSARLSNFLNGLKTKIAPKNQSDQYHLEYPGFDLAYGLPLDIPQPGNRAWAMVNEPDASLDAKRGATELLKGIQTALDSLFSSTSARVFIIYIPKRWANWERYDVDGENFDLHDSIKAYCIQKGKATQLIREKTVDYFDPCRVRWWLSLAIYVKAGRTPWILDTTDNETAFIGIGYTLLPNAPKGKHVVVGCSHIYNAAGLGLGFRLSKIDQPELDRRNNPYLSQDDARRLGENTKQLFHSSIQGLPSRVVIHKRTPFREQEVKGFLEGLSGIHEIDMIELTEEPALRYLNMKNIANGYANADSFPVRRGTCVPLDDNKALLWVHGVTEGLNPSQRFYLGGRSIPSPLMITRHYGDSQLSLLAREILGLSKMNWNNFDFYSHIPATIDTANDIARIGILLQRFGAIPFDYRLFI